MLVFTDQRHTTYAVHEKKYISFIYHIPLMDPISTFVIILLNQNIKISFNQTLLCI